MYSGRVKLWDDITGRELSCPDRVDNTVKLIESHLSQAKALAESFTEQTQDTAAYLRYDEDIGVHITEAIDVIKGELFSETMPPIPEPKVQLGTPIIVPNKIILEVLRSKLGRPLFGTYSRAKEVKGGVTKWEVFSMIVADAPLHLSGYIVEEPEKMFTTLKEIIEGSMTKYGI
jgi:hypothetical protein